MNPPPNQVPPTLRVGVIGAGMIAKMGHGPVLEAYAAQHPEIQLAAVCDPREAAASEFAALHGFSRTYTSHLDMLGAEDLGAVYVLVPPQLTARIAVDCLERKIPTFLEKPPGIDQEELDLIHDRARQHGTLDFVAFNRRHMPLMAELMAAMAETGAAPYRITYRLARYRRYDADFTTTAIHAIDAVGYLAGAPYQEVACRWQRHLGRPELRNYLVAGQFQNGTEFAIDILPDVGAAAETVRVEYPGCTLEAKLPVVNGADIQELAVYRDGHRTHVSRPAGDALGTACLTAHGFAGETQFFLDGIRAGQKAFPTHNVASARQSVAITHWLRHGPHVDPLVF